MAHFFYLCTLILFVMSLPHAVVNNSWLYHVTQAEVQGQKISYDELQRVVQRHDDIAKGVPPGTGATAPASANLNLGTAPPRSTGISFSPLLNVHEDDEPEDEFSLLFRRQAILAAQFNTCFHTCYYSLSIPDLFMVFLLYLFIIYNWSRQLIKRVTNLDYRLCNEGNRSGWALWTTSRRYKQSSR